MNLSRTDIILVGIIVGLIFYLYVMPTIKENMTEVEGDTKSVLKVDTNSCSRDCCKHSQWPVPHQTNNDKDHVSTNLMCNAGNGGGCVCLNKNEFEYLSSRAENGLDSF